MKTVGIIGGLGPETTADFYLEVVFSFFDKNKLNRPPMLTWNVPIPNKVEEDFIKTGEGAERYLPFLIDAARRLEKGGADFIVIPCNSVHIFIEEVRKSVAIPVLSIIDETVNFLKEKEIKEVGVLSTSTTIRQKLYDDKLKDNGIAIQIPNNDNQLKVGTIINNLVHSRNDEKDKEEILKIIDNMSSTGLKTIILACTDLQVIVHEHKNVQIYDTMAILAEATVRELLK